jgi:OmpA-OmpF porin, OOP family
MRSPFRPAALAPAIACLLAAAIARADGGFALDQFEPAPAGSPFFGVPGPAAPGDLVPRAMLTFDYAQRPVRLVGASGSTPIVAGQGFLRLDASLALWDRLLVSVDFPFAIAASGQDPKLAGYTFIAPKAAVGDLRLGASGRLVGDNGGPFQLGVGGYLFLPTGSAAAYTGDGAIRGSLSASVGGRLGGDVGFAWGASGGLMLRTASGDPHALTFGAGAAVLLWNDRIQLGPELWGSKPLGDTLPLATSGTALAAPASTNMELLVGGKLRVIGGLLVGAGAGPGILSGIGTPNFRAVLTAGWSPAAEKSSAAAEKKPIGDRDDDGIADDIDACPAEKGEPSSDPKKDGCPPSDRDHDGITDVDDACPTLPGVRSDDATKNGCPQDRDGDGVDDPDDACPDQAGAKSPDPKRNGCSPDRDGDGVLDGADACPDEPGVASEDAKWNGCPDDPDGDGIKAAADACPYEKGSASADPKDNGCPKFIRVTADEIVTTRKVEFKVDGKTKFQTIEPVSSDLLLEVRDAIVGHPEILKVEVQGHTDDSGNLEYNLKLSQERADAVLAWLVDAGVPREKLVAKGYGHTRPIADNRIVDGRQKNRRVQFVIVGRKGK